MTQQTPDEIRRDIEETRARLSSDVDAVAEKVSPAAAMDRQKNRIKDGLSNMKDKIMGTDDDQPIGTATYGTAYGEDQGPSRTEQLRDQVGGTLEDAGQNAKQVAHDVQRKAGEFGENVRDTAQDAGRKLADAPAAVQRKTRGNPLAAGLIAFGAGMLLAGLVPASRKEQEVAEQLKTKAEPLMRDAAEAAKGLAEDAKGPIAEAGEQLRQSASESVSNLRDEGQTHAEHLAGEAKESAQQVKDA